MDGKARLYSSVVDWMEEDWLIYLIGENSVVVSIKTNFYK